MEVIKEVQSINGPDPNKPSFGKTVKKVFWRSFWTIFLLSLVLGFLLGWFFYYKNYSNGVRTGDLVKFSERGDIFKTWEGTLNVRSGELVPTMATEKFEFSVQNDSIANLVRNLEGHNVKVTYVQYRRSLPWRGDSKYIVTEIVDNSVTPRFVQPQYPNVQPTQQQATPQQNTPATTTNTPTN